MADIMKVQLPNGDEYNIKDASAVSGPNSSTANHIVTFNDATGKVVKDSGFTIATSVPANAVFTDTKVEVVRLI